MTATHPRTTTARSGAEVDPTPAVQLSEARDRRHARVADLLDEYAACQDPGRRRSLMQQVVLEHRTVARSVAARYRNRGIDMADLEQIAALGLVKAATRWQPGQCTDFLQYAVPTMAGEIKRYFRDHSTVVRASRRIQELRSALSAQAELHPLADDAELAGLLNATRAEIREARDASAITHPWSLDTPAAEGADWRDTVGLQERGFDDVDDRDLVSRVLSTLDDQERAVVRMRFWEDLSQSEIGTRIGVSQMQVSRILKRIAERARATAGPAYSAAG